MPKAIVVYNKENRLIGTFKSVNSAAKHFGMKRETIIRNTQRESHTQNGFSFKYKEGVNV